MKKYFIVMVTVCFLSGCEANEITLDQLSNEQHQTENISPILLNSLAKSINKPIEKIEMEDYLTVEALELNVADFPLEQKHVEIDLSGISRMKNLKTLSLNKVNAKDYQFLNGLNELENLSIIGFTAAKLPSLSNNNLISLSLCEGDLSDLSILNDNTSLQYLSVSNNKFKDLSSTRSLSTLTVLDISNNPLGSIEFIRELPHLERLQVKDTPITDITAVQYLSKLSYLDIRGTKVTSIYPLKSLEKLSILLVNKKNISDLNLLNKEVKIAENGYEIND